MIYQFSSLANMHKSTYFPAVQSPSHVQFFAIPWTEARQASLSLLIFWSLPKVLSIVLVMPFSHLIVWYPPLLLPSILPSITDFSNESAVCIRYQTTRVPASASVLPMSNQGWFPLKLAALISMLSKGLSGVFSQFESISSLAIHLLFGPALITIHDHWEDHCLDYLDLCWQSNISAFQRTV